MAVTTLNVVISLITITSNKSDSSVNLVYTILLTVCKLVPNLFQQLGTIIANKTCQLLVNTLERFTNTRVDFTTKIIIKGTAISLMPSNFNKISVNKAVISDIYQILDKLSRRSRAYEMKRVQNEAVKIREKFAFSFA